MDNYDDSDLLDVTLPTLTTILQLKTKEMSDLLEGGISIESEESVKVCESFLEFANQIQETFLQPGGFHNHGIYQVLFC